MLASKHAMIQLMHRSYPEALIDTLVDSSNMQRRMWMFLPDFRTRNLREREKLKYDTLENRECPLEFLSLGTWTSLTCAKIMFIAFVKAL